MPAAWRSVTMIIAVAAAAATLKLAGTGQAATLTGTWHGAQKLPGVATLNQGGNAAVSSVSCRSAGNCSAAGWYLDGSGHYQVFVDSEVNGSWHTAVEVPGTATLNKGGKAQIYSLSCASAGNCAAGGYYTDGSGHTQAFVVNQVSGSWHSAVEVPGSGALNVTGNAEVNSVSCASAGNCSVGGYYKDGGWHYQAFVASEVNGSWHDAIEAPGSGTLNRKGNASIASVSCRSAGNCSAGGQYLDGSSTGQAFVISEVNGTWHSAIEVPGSGSLNAGGGAWVTSVSCGSAGNCSAAGSYHDSAGKQQVFVTNQVSGSWHGAFEVPGSGTLNAGGAGWIYALSCASAGNCSTVGSYFASYSHAFVASEVNGSWHSATQIPGTATLNAGKDAYATSVWCPSAGNCGAGGTYTDSSRHMQAFVASEVNGTWSSAIEVPGSGALNTGGSAGVNTVSCASAGNCAAGGSYTDSSGHHQAFVVNQS